MSAGRSYTVIRSTSGEVGCAISNGDGAARLLRHCVYHSPTGFETGYNGSGPADLALSILADLLDASPEDIQRKLADWSYRHRGAEQALLFHHQFKNEFLWRRCIAKGESYTLRAEEIEQWLAGVRRSGAEAARSAS